MTTALLHSSFGESFHRFLREGELRYPQCSECGDVLGYSVRCCRNGHTGVRWTQADGGATLEALTVYHQVYSGAFPVPYPVALVELQEGPRLVASVDADAATLRLGMQVRARVRNGQLVFVAA